MHTLARSNQGLPLYAQLRDHLRMLILSGVLVPGQKMPGVRQLADYLDINRHTISRALHDLKDQGLIVTEQGRGTFVAKDIPIVAKRNVERFMEVVRRAVEESQALGFSVEELSSAVLASGVNALDSGPDDLCIAFVECNPISLDRYAGDLRRELGIRVKPLLISDLRRSIAAGRETMADCELVVTTLGHMPEVRRILGDQREIHPVSVGPYLQVFLEVLALPEEYLVGIVTASTLGSLGMQQAMVQAGVPAERLRLASMEQRDRIAQVVREADALVVSFSAMEVVKPLLPDPSPPLIEYHNVLDQAGVEALKERLRDMRAKKTTVPWSGDRGVNIWDLQRALTEEDQDLTSL